MTPAEKVAATKKPRACRAQGASPPHAYPWVCKVRQERQKHRLALVDVAKGTGLTATAVWQIERGSEPLLFSALRLATFFGKTIEDL